MLTVGSLTSAAHTALSGIEQVTREVEEIARVVAAGVSTEPGSPLSDSFKEITKLPILRQHARANARVFSVANELASELIRMGRK